MAKGRLDILSDVAAEHLVAWDGDSGTPEPGTEPTSMSMCRNGVGACPLWAHQDPGVGGSGPSGP